MSIDISNEEMRIKLGAKLKTEVETLSGPIVLFHDTPFDDESIELFKTMTKEQITQDLLGNGYTHHNINQYFNN